MRVQSYFGVAALPALLLAATLAVAQEDAEAVEDDTAAIDTTSSVNTLTDNRFFTWSGDIRPLLAYADVDDRDGSSDSDNSAQARLRLRLTRGIVEGIQFGARIAGRCSADDCDFEWVEGRATPQSNGLANGQFTFDEAYLHFYRRNLFNLTIGRQQTRFVLRGGVFARSLDRNDSNNTNVTWTDGLHFKLRQLAGWRAHVILQHNAANGSGSVRRAPLDFEPDSARTSYFAGAENTDSWGPVVQRSLGITYLPNSLLVDGSAGGRRESYAGYVGRVVARWPQRSEGLRLRAGVEIGYAPEVPSSTGAGIAADVSGVAWNVSASLMDFKPRHNIGVAYARTGSGWLLSPNYTPNEESVEIRYQWRPQNFPALDARVRLREDLNRQAGATRKRQSLDAFVRLTWQFGR